MSASGAEYDVIVVGAGPAGSAAALTLARKGAKVLVIERSRSPGESNVSGGVLYGDFTKGYGLVDLVPGFDSEAPVERKIVSHEVNILSAPDGRGGGYHQYRLDGNSALARLGLFTVEIETGHNFSVLRSEFDRWLCDKAVAAGAELICGTTVKGLLTEPGSPGADDDRERDRPVLGATTSKGDISARVVIDCSGVTSKLVEEAGLRGPLAPRQIYHALKHTFRLPKEEIERRFRLREGEGRAINCFGDFMLGVGGSAFIFTNRATVSVGILASVDSMVRAFTEKFDSVGTLRDVLASFEAHPFAAELLEGAEPLELSAHNAPKGHLAMLKKPYGSGFLAAGDSLGGFIKIGPLFDGMRRAIASGIMAAESFLLASESGSYRASNLSRYKDKLAPLYEDVNRSGRESFFSESGFAYSTLPRFLFSSSIFSKRVKPTVPPGGSGRMEAPPAEADGPSALVTVDIEAASKSSIKPWIPSCPVGCFTLVTQKGAFSSYKDLYSANYKVFASSPENKGGLDVLAYRETVKDIEEGALAFEGASCVGCGLCGEIGPKEMVLFQPGDGGRGVRYRYG